MSVDLLRLDVLLLAVLCAVGFQLCKLLWRYLVWPEALRLPSPGEEARAWDEAEDGPVWLVQWTLAALVVAVGALIGVVSTVVAMPVP